jgi:uncharacterized membrane protein
LNMTVEEAFRMIISIGLVVPDRSVLQKLNAVKC